MVDMATSENRGVAFDVSFDNDLQRPKSSLPKRLSQRLSERENKTVTSSEELEEKQKKALERRKEHEKARLERIHATQESCRKIAGKVEILLEQDAKRNGLEGTQQIKAMSKREAAKVINSVTEEFNQMSSGLQQNITEISTTK
ncbi:uncharacterized protein LOC144449637 [Glandiceps talaboti]